MFTRKSSLLLSAALALGISPLANADILSAIPTYDGTTTFGPFPSTISIGNFGFAIPVGQKVTGGTITGTFGNNDVAGTTTVSAPADLFIAGGAIEVATCDDSLSYAAACDTGSSPTPWSYTLTHSNIASLATYFASGSIDLSAVQNGVFTVNTGAVTLDLTTAPIAATPEPGGLWLLDIGAMGGLFLIKRARA
jgi:hypothetical protein